MKPSPQILKGHSQRFPCSCIAMAIEYILKELGIIPIDFFEYQEDRKNDNSSEFCKTIYPDKILFKLQGLDWDRILPIVDVELNEGRMVYIILQVEPDPKPAWHAFVIFDKTKEGHYKLITSSYMAGKSWEETRDLRTELPKMRNLGIITYALIDNKEAVGNP